MREEELQKVHANQDKGRVQTGRPFFMARAGGELRGV